MATNDFDLRDDPPKPETEDSEPEDQLVQDEGKIKVFVGSKAPTNPLNRKFHECSKIVLKLRLDHLWAEGFEN